MSNTIHTFKGFNRDLTCNGYQFEEGKEYEQSGEIRACQNGFHACERPLDVFRYYPPGSSVYHEVEQSGELSRNDDDSKVASGKIKIGAEVSISELVEAQIKYTKARTTNEHTNLKRATAGDRGAATAANYGAATAGDYGAATAGNNGAATAGDNGAATAGDYGAATAGNSGVATTGEFGVATSRGKSAVGENGIACARGAGVKVKGGLGALLVIGIENNFGYDLTEWKAVVVDGEAIKPDTWYTLKNGELIEA